MERIPCQKCKIGFNKRGLLAHQIKCNVNAGGFVPYFQNGRYSYRCERCLKVVRKQNMIKHQQHCYQEGYNQTQKQKLEFVTAYSSLQKSQAQISNIGQQGQQQVINENKSDEVYLFQKKPDQPFIFYCPLRKQQILIEFENTQLDEEPKIISEEQIEREKISASLQLLTGTEVVAYHPKLLQFRKNKSATNPSLAQTVEIFTLSCFLRIIGKFTHEKKWQLCHGLIKKSIFWDYFRQALPWIVNNQKLAEIANEKLKYFSHNAQYFVVNNFNFIYLRLKGLIQNFTINPAKFSRIFEKPIKQRKFNTRRKRKDPQTAELRRKISIYKSKQKKLKNLRKNPYGMRLWTKIKYQHMLHQIQSVDQLFEMKQVFRRKVSIKHRAQEIRRRQKMMINYCMKTIAQNLTASIIFGEFKTWQKSIQSINPEERYLYANKIPSHSSFQVWYPITIDILKERKWYYPYVYKQCQKNFSSPIPKLSEDQIYSSLEKWYRSKGLIIDHALYEFEGFDQVRAVISDKYRIEQQKKRTRMKTQNFVINPPIIFPEEPNQSEQIQQDILDEQIVFDARIPYRGDSTKWKILHQFELVSGYKNCSACQKFLKFPAPSCLNCSAAYHYQCRKQLHDICLCFAYQLNDREQRTKMFIQAINQASLRAKHVDLKIKTPPKASIMQLKYQEQNIGLNLQPLTHIGLWCQPGNIFYNNSSNIMYLKQKSLEILDKFGKIYVFPVIIEEIVSKGRGVFASRDIFKDQIVAVYSGILVNQSQVESQYKNCKYIFNFDNGKTPFISFAVVPQRVAHLGLFINHGTPNVFPNRFWSSKGPIIIFISSKKIQRGQQILYDYREKNQIRQKIA